MEKKIQDYLHLYLGQRCKISSEDDRDGWEQDLTAEVLLKQMDDDEYKWVQPLLRPLSDIENTELEQLVQILLRKDDVHVVIERSDEGDFIMATYNTVYPETDFDKERYDKLQMRLTLSNIHHSFSIQNNWDYVKGNGTGISNQQLFNCHEITRYLLSKGFDLFNLIPEGLAIDATTLKEKSTTP